MNSIMLLNFHDAGCLMLVDCLVSGHSKYFLLKNKKSMRFGLRLNLRFLQAS